jgi:hypothetical protein
LDPVGETLRNRKRPVHLNRPLLFISYPTCHCAARHWGAPGEPKRTHRPGLIARSLLRLILAHIILVLINCALMGFYTKNGTYTKISAYTKNTKNTANAENAANTKNTANAENAANTKNTANAKNAANTNKRAAF